LAPQWCSTAADLLIILFAYILSFAAGTMIYVVVEELIPEAQAGEHSNLGKSALPWLLADDFWICARIRLLNDRSGLLLSDRLFLFTLNTKSLISLSGLLFLRIPRRTDSVAIALSVYADCSEAWYLPPPIQSKP
jgi:hypothetical protein